jgi:hypothetical protein
MNEISDSELDERLASLPQEHLPRTDLWPDLRASLERRHSRSWRGVARGLAAAAALFLAGLWLGQQIGDRRPPSTTAEDGLAAAAEVQRAGTAYVKALAELRAAKSRVAPAVIVQGRDAGMAAVAGAAWELERLFSHDPVAAQILALATKDREGR